MVAPGHQRIVKHRWWLVLSAVVILTACEGNQHDKVGAYVACEDFARDRLLAPATADFAGVTGSIIDSLPAATYQVASYVDAQNAFGAQIRKRFTCRVRYQASDSSWNLLAIDMDADS